MTPTPTSFEVNLDGLVGPTHNYAGLSYGNLASQRSRKSIANPKAAALEGLAKMKMLADLGLKQAVLPPHARQEVDSLRRLGFGGSDADVLYRAHREDPVLLASCCSASAMWAANAATISPAADTADARVHLTPANLISQFHRSLEAHTTASILQAIFRDEAMFTHHPPLPAAAAFGDEGAANHVRLAPAHGAPGIELFVYGRSAFDAFQSSNAAATAVSRFPARQTREASAAISRVHLLDPARVVFARQNPAAIDAGVFHNDVIAVGNENVLLYHEHAYVETARVVADLSKRFAALGAGPLVGIEVTETEVPLADAVGSYLFNSQLLTLPDGTMMLLAPSECREFPSTMRFLEQLPARATPISSIHFVDVRQSMNNGGGPACLRLRVVLTADELTGVRASVFLDEQRYEELATWIRRHYRDQLAPDDLADPKLLTEGRDALDELTEILGLGSIYPFQR